MANPKVDITSLSALRALDRGLYAVCLYVPERYREALASLHLFDAETRRIRDLVSEPLPGEIRLQWWRDVLSGERAGEAQANPAASALLSATQRFGLEAKLLERLADARIFDLYDDPMPSVSDFEAYCGQTWSTIVQLTSRILSSDGQMHNGTAAGHAGCAMGVAWVLANLPVHRRRGQMFLPADMLKATGADRDSYLAGQPERMAVALDAFVEFGFDHATKAQSAIKLLPKRTRLAFLPLALAQLTLEIAQKQGIKALSEPVTISPLRQQWRLFRAAAQL